jgi:hypothetical protein
VAKHIGHLGSVRAVPAFTFLLIVISLFSGCGITDGFSSQEKKQKDNCVLVEEQGYVIKEYGLRVTFAGDTTEEMAANAGSFDEETMRTYLSVEAKQIPSEFPDTRVYELSEFMSVPQQFRARRKISDFPGVKEVRFTPLYTPCEPAVIQP